MTLASVQRAGLVGLMLTVLSAGCTPTVTSSVLVIVDGDGVPISTFRVPLTPVGRVELVPIIIQNVGGDTSPPMTMAMSGEASAEFTIQPGTCVGAVLEPDVTCRTFLEFRAQVVGMRDAQLTITTDASTILDLQTDVFQSTAR